MSLFDLSGRVALITGSSRGLGRAMVEGMAAAGTAVFLASAASDYVNGQIIYVDGGMSVVS